MDLGRTDIKVDEDKQEVVMSRVFHASRQRIWQAHTDPKLVVRWWGPEGQTTIEELDVRVGGRWRILHIDNGGKEHWYSGEYQEVVEPAKIVRTFIYEAVQGNIISETFLFEEYQTAKTKVTITYQLPSNNALKGLVNAGFTQSLDRLGKVAETFSQRKENI